MNKKRISKSIGFLAAGAISFLPLLFLGDAIRLITEEESTRNLAHNIGKAVFLTLGFILLAVGLYNLIMIFLGEEDTKKGR